MGLQAARGQGAEAASANRQGRSVTERCWSFVDTDDRTNLFKSTLLPGWCGSCCDARLNLLTRFAEILQVLILSVSVKRDYYFWVACKSCKSFVRC